MLTTALVILLTALLLGYGAWFLFEFIRYMLSGQYDIDKRIWKVTKGG
jgi:hypothetical protein